MPTEFTYDEGGYINYMYGDVLQETTSTEQSPPFDEDALLEIYNKLKKHYGDE